ncbi:MAG: hypothetical protein ABR555_18490 [Pyrinomonadaceae bacterium]
MATIGFITGHKDKTLISHYGHASTESRETMDVLEQFAGAMNLGLGLDTNAFNGLLFGGMRKGLVPEVGLEPT